ncbi:nuclear transport factor 2 family protein [Streptomyces sp. NPDC058378]|uniref:nuclear transport factor 2 family protein n=1 Tax=Streptomyces sp. NPDC058378 TaxID=3346469 RepID=UPI0036596A57
MSKKPEDVFRRLLELMLAKEMDAAADLWAPDGIAEFPFAAGRSPRRLSGREQVRAYLASYPDRMDMREVAALTVRTTDDPDTAVVEWTSAGRTVRTSEPYRLDYIVVLTVRHGLIALYRDFWSPVAAAHAAGGLPELIETLDEEMSR